MKTLTLTATSVTEKEEGTFACLGCLREALPWSIP